MRTMPVDEAVALIRGTVGTDRTTRTDPEVAIDSIAAELVAAREWRSVPGPILARLLEIREQIKHGYPEAAEYLARLASGWGVES